MLIKNAPNMKNPEEKLSWIFTVFDQDGGGSIEVEELYEIVQALVKMAGKEKNNEEEEINENQEECNGDGNHDAKTDVEEKEEKNKKTDESSNEKERTTLSGYIQEPGGNSYP